MSKGQRTRERLVASFVGLAAQVPYDQITVRDITRECGMSRQAFYYHFHSIHDLAAWVCHQRVTQALLGIREASGATCVEAILRILFQERQLVLGIMASDARAELESLMKDELRLVAMRLVEDQFADSELSVSQRALVARFYAGGTMEIVEAWIDDGMREKPDHLAGRLNGVYTAGRRSDYTLECSPGGKRG